MFCDKGGKGGRGKGSPAAISTKAEPHFATRKIRTHTHALQQAVKQTTPSERSAHHCHVSRQPKTCRQAAPMGRTKYMNNMYFNKFLNMVNEFLNMVMVVHMAGVCYGKTSGA